MKKGIHRTAVAVVMAAGASVLLVGCQKEEKEVKRDIVLSDYIELGEYKNITIDYIEAEVYTEEMYLADINTYLDYIGEYTLEEITDHTEAEEGDTVAIDYVGMMDGEAFSGGTGSKDLTLGSGAFIDGFEDGLIGAQVGDVITLDLTFPEDYQSSSLAGQPVQFEVTVNGLYTKIMNELTDELANSLFNYETAEDCKLDIINSTNATNISEAQEEMENAAMDKILADSTISSYPEELWQEYYDVYYGQYASYATAYGLELSTLLSYYGMTEDELKEECETYADVQCQYYLVLMSIAEKEGITVSDEEYETYVAEQLEANSITEEEFFSQVTELDVRENITGNKVIDYIMENVVYNGAPE